MNKIPLDPHLCRGKFEMDLDNPRLDGIVGLSDVAAREVDFLRKRYPEVDSVGDRDKAQMIFRWIVPHPKSTRELKNGRWERKQGRYHSERIFDDSSDIPTINCFGYGILGTVMSRQLGLDAHVEHICVTELGDQTTHACFRVGDNGTTTLVDPTFGVEHYDQAFDAKHRLHNLTPDKTVFHIILAYHFAHTGENDKEMEHYLKALEIMDKQPDLLLNLGINEYNLGRKRQALELIERSLEHFPDCTTALKQAGDICAELGEPAKARGYYAQAASNTAPLWDADVEGKYIIKYRGVNPDMVRAKVRLALMDLKQDGNGELKRILEEATKEASEARPEIKRWDPETNSKVPLRTYPAWEIFDADTFHNIGVDLENHGEINSAIEFYERSLEVAPKDRITIEALAKVYCEVGRIDDAVRLESNNPDVSLSIAEAYEGQGKTAKAKRFYERALEELKGVSDVPDNAITLHNVGAYFENHGKPKKAIELYERTLKVAPKDQDTIEALAKAYAKTGKTEDAVKLNPTDPDTLFFIAEAYEKQGRFVKSREFYERALEQAPDDVITLNNLAALLINRGYTRKAEAHLEHALKITPKDRTLLNNLQYCKTTS